MAIPGKRFDRLSEDTNIGVIDFLDGSNEAPVSGNEEPGVAVKAVEKYKETVQTGRNILPVALDAVDSKAQVVSSFIDSLKPGTRVPGLSNKTLIEGLYDDITGAYNQVVGTGTSLLNKVVAFGNVNECDRAANDLRRLMGKFGTGFRELPDPNILKGALLGVLRRLACAGSTNLFSSITGISSDVRLLIFAGSSILTDAVLDRNPEVIIDLGNTPPQQLYPDGPMVDLVAQIRTEVPNIAGRAVKSLEGFTGSPGKDPLNTFNSFKTALNNLDPGWNNHGTYTDLSAIRHTGKYMEPLLDRVIVHNTPEVNTVDTVATLDDNSKLLAVVSANRVDSLPYTSSTGHRDTELPANPPVCPDEILNIALNQYMLSRNPTYQIPC